MKPAEAVLGYPAPQSATLDNVMRALREKRSGTVTEIAGSIGLRFAQRKGIKGLLDSCVENGLLVKVPGGGRKGSVYALATRP